MKKRKIPISSLKISAQAKKYILQVLKTNRLSYGPLTQKFEEFFAKIHNRKYAIFVNSGTSALQVGLHALKQYYGWNDNDEIIVPAVTFISTSNIVLHNRLKPVFVDVEEDYYCIDPKKIEEKITSKTRAIIPVHIFGQSADMESIIKLAKKYNLKILEDSCEAMFVKYKGKPVGSQGDIAAFSTYIAHIISTGVGGIITTNNPDLAEIMKSLTFHGRDNIYLKIDDSDTTDKKKIESLIQKRFQFTNIGYSYRLTEIEGALGLAGIERKDQIVKKRQKIGRDMVKTLEEFSDYFQLPQVRPQSEHIYMLFPIIIKNKKIDRNDFLLYLENNGIETRLFFPLLSQPVYKKLFGDIQDQYPVTEKLVKNGFIIGSHPTFTQSDIKYVHDLFKKYLAENIF